MTPSLPPDTSAKPSSRPPANSASPGPVLSFPPRHSAPPRAAVFFDAVHTLFDLEPDYAGAFARVARDFGYEVEMARVEAGLKPLLEDLDRRKQLDISHACTPESLEAEWIEFNITLFRAMGIDGDARILSLEMERRFDSGQYASVYPEAWGVLDSVRSLGLATGIITNGTAGMKTCLAALGLSERVDAVLVSALVGFEKPAVEIFQRAEGTVGVPAERCLLVGDNYWADIAGARRAGWEAIWVNRKGLDAPGHCLQAASLTEIPGLVRDWLKRNGLE